MNNLLFIPLAIAYFLVSGLLFLFGLNFMYLTFISLRKAPDKQQRPRQLKEWPRVTVQLPIYNEMYVAERLVQAACRLEYPKDRLEIQVLDDSTDETRSIVSRAVKAARANGTDIKVIHREDRAGYKAGALRAGFAQASGEFFAIFDADFLPQPEFLLQTVPHFEDPQIAFVQTRWGHVNRDFSFLTLIQSLAIDAHFMVEQLARSRSGLWFNFNGTAGIWRREAIEHAGGWKADTLTEDLDLSYRAFLKGWRARYLSAVETPAEVPITFNAFRRQQHRWARGSLECAARLLPAIWAGRHPLRTKVAATFHLGGYGVHLLLFAYCLLQPLAIVYARDFPGLISLFSVAYLFSLTILAPSLLLFAGQYQLGRPWWRWLPVILFISAFGGGMMLNTVRAALEVSRGKPGEFRRTPKFGVEGKTGVWMKKQYHLKLDPIVFWELGFSAFNFGTLILGISSGFWLASLYSGIFALGCAFTALYTISQTISINRVQRAAALSVPN
ncbi:MAG TPA: glycosyltransferase [Anaerolineales bacterium]|jgi:cellulose synthase/poly-beta-1,6-N-acetylglucosamine synthase-like glycosyltransferase